MYLLVPIGTYCVPIGTYCVPIGKAQTSAKDPDNFKPYKG